MTISRRFFLGSLMAAAGFFGSAYGQRPNPWTDDAIAECAHVVMYDAGVHQGSQADEDWGQQVCDSKQMELIFFQDEIIFEDRIAQNAYAVCVLDREHTNWPVTLTDQELRKLKRVDKLQGKLLDRGQREHSKLIEKGRTEPGKRFDAWLEFFEVKYFPKLFDIARTHCQRIDPRYCNEFGSCVLKRD